MIAELKQFIANEILRDPGYDIADDDALISSGLIDSFSLVDLALIVENTFGVYVDDTELNAEAFDTLRELAELIRDRQA